jgi:two-component system, OmpR family, KDP operon response regulator KdpE
MSRGHAPSSPQHSYLKQIWLAESGSLEYRRGVIKLAHYIQLDTSKRRRLKLPIINELSDCDGGIARHALPPPPGEEVWILPVEFCPPFCNNIWFHTHSKPQFICAEATATVMKTLSFERRSPHVCGTTNPPKHAATNIALVIDHERQARRFVADCLYFYNYSVSEAEDGAAGLSAAIGIRPDLIILDPELPDMTGDAFLKTIRSWSNVPVIILSMQSEEECKVHFLRSGADDYMTKPFGIRELAARCEAVLRRYHQGLAKDSVVRTGPLALDLVTHEVTLNGCNVMLTRQEYRLLHLLATHLGLVITHNQIIQEIWSDDLPNNVQYLRSLVRRLRQKLEVDPSQPQLLVSQAGVGYRLERGRRHSDRIR